ncbi:hypothetical protein L4D00_07710 [Photobacterium swingsii]|uniref:Lipoprotein n=1 Tax=Photobacterium swingsii TaxID=680026 RepID=A0A0J8VAZ9_9GAMM|nr:hypothetical protein [Photobacterium swingsii]KMV29750.1 hypothetical protein AB733_15675 [Photobacterium swingsii]PSW22864.1 hypothetical protein C9I94_19000 [Photobacterium swingsii]
MKIIKGIIIAAMLTGVVGCSRMHPVLNVDNAPVSYNVQAEQVRSVILQSGTDRGWIMAETKPGTIRGEINVRTHKAVIDIEYNAKTYSIHYVSSENLKYEDGKIHRNYNRWVNNLDVDIKKNLAKIAQ